MINKYEVIGREKIVYKSVVLANSSDEAEKKFRDYLMDVNLKYFIKLKQFYKDGELESASGRFC